MVWIDRGREKVQRRVFSLEVEMMVQNERTPKDGQQELTFLSLDHIHVYECRQQCPDPSNSIEAHLIPSFKITSRLGFGRSKYKEKVR